MPAFRLNGLRHRLPIKLAMVSLSLGLLQAGAGAADEINITCYGNRDGTLSCQRLRDGKWFVCVASVGRTSTCRSDDGEPITCIRTGDGVSECRTTARPRTGFEELPGLSVFGR